MWPGAQTAPANVTYPRIIQAMSEMKDIPSDTNVDREHSHVRREAASASSKKPTRDSKRRASHSQIERRRREKINDRLITLRTIVPACAAEVEERRKQRLQEEDEARRMAAGELIVSTGGESDGKRRRKRRRAAAALAAAKNGDGAAKRKPADKEDELGLHKLEVLTHAIEYIFELEARLQELQTGVPVARKQICDEEEAQATKDALPAGVPMEDSGIRTRPASANADDLSQHSMDVDESHQNYTSSWHQHLPDADPTRLARQPTASSTESSSSATSPTFTNFTAPGESPMFAGGSTPSTYTSLTSSMMSLSAESPILRWNSNTAASANRPSLTLPKYDDAKRERGVPVQYLPMLPEPAIPLPHDQESRLVSQSPDRIADVPHGAKAIAPDQQAAPPYRDARLLLSLKASVSPESLRPVTSSVREDLTSSVQEDDPAWGPHTYPRIVRPRRSSVSTPRTTTSTQNSANVAVPPPSSFSRIKYRYADPHTHKLMGGSAPGGAYPTTSFSSSTHNDPPRHSLPSPPLLSLDSPRNTGRQKGPQEDHDR